jgi:hypothetical protein
LSFVCSFSQLNVLSLIEYKGKIRIRQLTNGLMLKVATTTNLSIGGRMGVAAKVPVKTFCGRTYTVASMANLRQSGNWGWMNRAN